MSESVSHWDEGDKNVLKFIVIATELIVLNVYTWLFFRVLGDPFSIMARYDFFISMNVAYLVTVFFYGPVLLYRRITSKAVLKRSVRTFSLIFVLFLVVALLLHFHMFIHYKRLILYFGFYLFILTSGRLLGRQIMRHYRRKSDIKRGLIFVGVSHATFDLLKNFHDDPAWGYEVIGYFADEENEQMGDVPYKGRVSDVEAFAQNPDSKVKEMFCFLPSDHEADIANLVTICDKYLIEFRLVPNFWNYIHRPIKLLVYGETPLMVIRRNTLSDYRNRFYKRFFDIVFSALFLVLIFPWVFLVVGTIMKITMPGPIFFKQKRNGVGGKIFWCYKFRSMKVNKDSDTLQATKDDPRKTKFGNFMRHTNIDELPQFWNVLMGNMSVVGPRPHMVKHTEEYSKLIPEYMVRHFAKPGITGWAQVNGCRGETRELSQMQARVEKDIYYIENWSFMLDLKIIWMTIHNTMGNKDEMAY